MLEKSSFSFRFKVIPFPSPVKRQGKGDRGGGGKKKREDTCRNKIWGLPNQSFFFLVLARDYHRVHRFI